MGYGIFTRHNKLMLEEKETGMKTIHTEMCKVDMERITSLEDVKAVLSCIKMEVTKDSPEFERLKACGLIKSKDNV